MATQNPQPDTLIEVPGNPAPERVEVAWIKTASGQGVRVCYAPSPQADARGTVLLCPGRTEFIEKYFEVARELQARGFGVLVIDWPGQGLSDRLLDDPLKGHIDSFETFTEALQAALKHFGRRLSRPHIILAHSMGGAIALTALARNLIQVEAAAFSAPMWGIQVPFFAAPLAWLFRRLGLGGRYAQGQGAEETFEANVVTHDRERWARQQDLIRAEPALALGSVTWGWIGASLDTLKQTTRASLLAGIDIPVLVASAAEEKLVDNRAHARVAGYLPNCTHITVESARHEILMETDDKRAKFWSHFDSLLEKAGL